MKYRILTNGHRYKPQICKGKKWSWSHMGRIDHWTDLTKTSKQFGHPSLWPILICDTYEQAYNEAKNYIRIAEINNEKWVEHQFENEAQNNHMKIGTSVKVKHNPAYDLKYDRIAQSARAMLDIKVVIVLGKRRNAHGECFEVTDPERHVIAWYEPDELTPVKYGINQVAMGCKSDPTNFKINELEHVGDCTIIVANYGGLTFGGDKLMVLRGIFNKHDITVLDPHFLNEDHPVIARFQPTPEGIHLARIVANSLTRQSH